MNTISFISALYNEQEEVFSLLTHVNPYVDYFYLADDGSTDKTITYIRRWTSINGAHSRLTIIPMEHTGLPETVKNEALKGVHYDSWTLMLDADERFEEGVLPQIRQFIDSPESEGISYVYFRQHEIIDGAHVRTFQKSKLFKPRSIKFPTGIHEDDQFTGTGVYKDEWVVLHRKTSDKQRLRETEYLQTYKNLLADGRIDEGRYQWLRGLHHFIKE